MQIPLEASSLEQLAFQASAAEHFSSTIIVAIAYRLHVQYGHRTLKNSFIHLELLGLGLCYSAALAL